MASKGQLGLELLPGELDTPAFQEAWHAWLDDRRERRLPRYTARAQSMQLNRLAAMGEQSAIAAIEWSIAQGYKGIFPPPASSTAGKPAPSEPSTWEIKTKLDAVEARLRQLKSRSPGEHCSLADFLSAAEIQEMQQLQQQRTTLQNQLTRA